MNEQDYDKAEKNLGKCNCDNQGMSVEVTYHSHVCAYRMWFEKIFGN
jgi:hypothetical protein